MTDTWIALAMSLFAGLATGLGGLAVFFDKSTSKVFMSAALGFSAGVMFYISFGEIFVSAQDKIICAVGDAQGGWIAAAALFGGMLLIALIERFIPSGDKALEKLGDADDATGGKTRSKLMRTGVLTAAAIAVHNFPEGLATFVSALDEPSVAVPVVFAVAIHNIPEGIAVAVPLYRAIGSRPKAFLFSLLSGLAEPVGALIGMLVLLPIMSDLVFGIVFALTAGIMIFIAVDELLPTAREGSATAATAGAVCGMAVMAVSLLLF